MNDNGGVLVWTVKEGNTTEIRFDDRLWIPKANGGMGYKRTLKKPFLVKWMHDTKKIDDIFCLKDFYEVYPKHEYDSACKKRISRIISDLVRDDVLLQLENNRFKLLKELE